MKVHSPETREDARLSILIYSLTGGGKTHLLGTATDCPELSPILIVDVGGGMTTLTGHTVKITRPKNMGDIQELHDYFRHKNWKNGQQRFRSVGLDGLTGIQQELIMPLVKEEGDDPYEDLAQGVPPDRQDWLKSHEVVRRVLRAFRDLCLLPDPERSVHVLMTALEKADDRREIICPQLPGVMGIECGSYIDILARLSVETRGEENSERTARYLLTEEWNGDDGMTYLAKNRGNALGSGIWQPTMKKLYRKWKSAT